MRIISQNVTNYGISVPEDTIFRINLAWCDSINSLETVLKRHENDEIFLDLPARLDKESSEHHEIKPKFSAEENNYLKKGLYALQLRH